MKGYIGVERSGPDANHGVVKVTDTDSDETLERCTVELHKEYPGLCFCYRNAPGFFNHEIQ